jgi:hypothetical protein
MAVLLINQNKLGQMPLTTSSKAGIFRAFRRGSMLAPYFCTAYNVSEKENNVRSHKDRW